MRTSSAAALLVVALAASGCKGPTDPSQNHTDPFSGSVQPLSGGPIHGFTDANTGEFTITVTSLTPGNAYVGIGYGATAGSQCSFQQTNVVGPPNIGKASLSGRVIVTGAYCVQLFDPSLSFPGYPALTVPQNYTIQVSHP